MASPTPPPQPPPGPPQGVPPSSSPGYSAPPPAAPKKISPLVWILGGCGGLVLLLGLVLLVAGVFVAKKVGDVAKDAGRNPAVFAAKLIAAANPDIEVVDSDDEHGTVTLRNRKTGEEITVDAEDIKEGRLTFRDEKGEEVTFEASSGEGSGSARIRAGDRTVTFGESAEEPPDWVPSYPGVEPTGFYSNTAPEGVSGAWSFTTEDSPREILDYYLEELEGAGFEVSSSDFRRQGQVAGGMLTAQDEATGRSVNVGVSVEDGVTQVVVNFSHNAK